jgi:hypothetical protein
MKINTLKTIFIALNLFLTVSITTNSFGQFHKGFLITKNNDTVTCEIFATSYFNNELNLSSLTKSIVTKNNGERQKYKPIDITGFSITCPVRGKLYFASIPQDKNNFFQVLTSGRISLYNLHISHLDGSGYPAPILHKNDKLVYLNVINRKKRVENLISDYPRLCEDWKNNKYGFNEINEVVLEYNQFFANENNSR